MFSILFCFYKADCDTDCDTLYECLNECSESYTMYCDFLFRCFYMFCGQMCFLLTQ